jgi:hypothetical protein
MRARALRTALARSAASDSGALAMSGLRGTLRCEGPRARVDLTRDDGTALTDGTALEVVTNDYLATSGLRARLERPLDDAETLRSPLLREPVEGAPRAMGPEIRGDDPRFFDPRAPRIALPGPRPLRCE